MATHTQLLLLGAGSCILLGCTGGPSRLEAPYPMVRVEPTEFTMGSPPEEVGRDHDETAHPVTLTRRFWIGVNEVEQRLFSTVMGENPSAFPECGPTCPVEQVSWSDALRFANALSLREDLEVCYVAQGDHWTWPRGLDCVGFRLPTEAEWEVAARAGQTMTFSGSASIDAVGWYGRNSEQKTHPVAQKSPNAWGLYDFSGNVWEWVWDAYGPYPAEAVDPMGPATGTRRVRRGGGWYHAPPRALRVADRNGDETAIRSAFVGIRLARTVP